MTLDPLGKEPVTSVQVSFEYLDPRQGAAIELLHTAEAPDNIEVRGTIMGIPKGIAHVATSVHVEVPPGVLGAFVAVTIPTHVVPRNLRVASGIHTTRQVDVTIQGLLATALRFLLP